MTESGKRRIFRCRECETTFSETRDTVFFDLRTPEEKVIMALKMLLVRLYLQGISFVLGVTEETVLEWLRRAAEKADQINQHLLRDLPVTSIQLDQMWNFVRRKHACETTDEGESLPEGTDGRQWIFVSYAPEHRLVEADHVGSPALETTKEVVRVTAARERGIPAFFSDGFTCYAGGACGLLPHSYRVCPNRQARPTQGTEDRCARRFDLRATDQREEAREVAARSRGECCSGPRGWGSWG
jgi:hypothetical protein